jgi:hypothetical protein
MNEQNNGNGSIEEQIGVILDAVLLKGFEQGQRRGEINFDCEFNTISKKHLLDVLFETAIDVAMEAQVDESDAELEATSCDDTEEWEEATKKYLGGFSYIAPTKQINDRELIIFESPTGETHYCQKEDGLFTLLDKDEAMTREYTKIELKV